MFLILSMPGTSSRKNCSFKNSNIRLCKTISFLSLSLSFSLFFGFICSRLYSCGKKKKTSQRNKIFWTFSLFLFKFLNSLISSTYITLICFQNFRCLELKESLASYDCKHSCFNIFCFLRLDWHYLHVFVGKLLLDSSIYVSCLS